MKVGIIRYLMTEDICPGTMGFVATKGGKGAFQETRPVEIVGFVTCGGCHMVCFSLEVEGSCGS